MEESLEVHRLANLLLYCNKTRDPVSNKEKAKEQHLRLSSDHTCSVFCVMCTLLHMFTCMLPTHTQTLSLPP